MHVEIKNYSANESTIVTKLIENFGPAKFFPANFASQEDKFKDYNFEQNPDRWAFGPSFSMARDSRVFYFRHEKDALMAALLFEV